MILFLDIDGTLLNSQHAIGEQDSLTIKNFRENNLIILTSARKPSAMRGIQDELGISMHPLICYNGALILDGDRIVYSKPIDHNTIRCIVDIALSAKAAINFYYYDTWATNSLNSFVQNEADIVGELPTVVDPFDWHQPAHKILLLCKSEEEDSIIRLLSPIKGICVSISKPSYIEITADNVTKGLAVQFFTAGTTRPFPSTIAIGDGENDISLFYEVTFSVAMLNAPQHVRDIASFTTLSNDQNGVSFAIKHFFSGYKN